MTAPGTARTLDIEPVTFDRIVVPVDGSALSISALAPAAALARTFGAGLELIGFGDDAVEARALGGLLESLAARVGATAQTGVGRDAARAILEALAGRDRPLLCMASHGRGGIGVAVLGSVANALLAAVSDPVLLIGPHFDPDRTLDGDPVLACVDGSPASEVVVGPAASWALALGVPLGITTVAEPVAEPLVGQPYRRRHGPEGDAFEYVAGIAAAWQRLGVEAQPVVIYDTLGPAAGLWDYLGRRTGGLVAVRTRGLTGWARTVLGSEAAAIVRTSSVPVLVVPPHF